MRTKLAIAALSAVMALILPSVVAAGQPQPGTAAPTATSAPAPAPPGALPVSLERIRRQLREQNATSELERFEDFRLLTSLNVYGSAPRFELFTPDDSVNTVSSIGPVRYGGMTHQEFLQQVTPRNFQAPVMNLSGGLFSLTNWLSDKRRESARKKDTEARQAK